MDRKTELQITRARKAAGYALNQVRRAARKSQAAWESIMDLKALLEEQGENKMGIVKNDDIRGYVVEEEIVCDECVTAKEREDSTEEEVLVEDEEVTRFCDRCKKQF